MAVTTPSSSIQLFILSFSGEGIGTALLHRAAKVARLKGAEWLHVDFESRLEPFYRNAGYKGTSAGLLRLGTVTSRAV